MSSIDILKEALQLNAQERYIVIENLLKSLDTPDKNVENIWANEAMERLEAYRNGEVKPISFESVFSA